jgi:hypothetical protein
MTTIPGDVAKVVAFMENRLLELEDAWTLGDTDAAAKIECLRQILRRVGAPPPKPRPGRPTLVYSRKAPLERAG